MKKLLIVLLAAITLQSCSSDEQVAPQKDNSSKPKQVLSAPSVSWVEFDLPSAITSTTPHQTVIWGFDRPNSSDEIYVKIAIDTNSGKIANFAFDLNSFQELEANSSTFGKNYFVSGNGSGVLEQSFPVVNSPSAPSTPWAGKIITNPFDKFYGLDDAVYNTWFHMKDLPAGVPGGISPGDLYLYWYFH